MKKNFSLFSVFLSCVVCASSDHRALDDEAPLPPFVHLRQYAPKTGHIDAPRASEAHPHLVTHGGAIFLPVPPSQDQAFASSSAYASTQSSSDLPFLHAAQPTPSQKDLATSQTSASKELPTQELLTHIRAIKESTKTIRYSKKYKECVELFLKEQQVTPKNMYARMEMLGQKDNIDWKKEHPFLYRTLVALRAKEKADKTGICVQAPRGKNAKRSYDTSVSTQTLLEWFMTQDTPRTSPEEYSALIKRAAQTHNLTFAAISGRLETLKQKYQADKILWTTELENLRKYASQVRMKFYTEKKQAENTQSQDTSTPASKAESLVEWFKEQNMPMTNSQECYELIQKAAQEHGLEYSTIFGRLDRYKKKFQKDVSLWTPALELLRKSTSQVRMKIYREEKKDASKKSS